MTPARSGSEVAHAAFEGGFVEDDERQPTSISRDPLMLACAEIGRAQPVLCMDQFMLSAMVVMLTIFALPAGQGFRHARKVMERWSGWFEGTRFLSTRAFRYTSGTAAGA
jgi:hypothetical protein